VPGRGGVLYTSAFVDRHFARLRGAFSAVTSPGPIARLRQTNGLQDSLCVKQLEQLLKQQRLVRTHPPAPLVGLSTTPADPTRDAL
jgi:hypothetical protein